MRSFFKEKKSSVEATPDLRSVISISGPIYEERTRQLGAESITYYRVRSTASTMLRLVVVLWRCGVGRPFLLLIAGMSNRHILLVLQVVPAALLTPRLSRPASEGDSSIG